MKWIRNAFTNTTSVHHGHCHEVTIECETEAHGVIALEDYIMDLARSKIIRNGMGHYTERYRYEEGAWRIAETKLTRLFCGGEPVTAQQAFVQDESAPAQSLSPFDQRDRGFRGYARAAAEKHSWVWRRTMPCGTRNLDRGYRP
jgi:hypothetical protein